MVNTFNCSRLVLESLRTKSLRLGGSHWCYQWYSNNGFTQNTSQILISLSSLYFFFHNLSLASLEIYKIRICRIGFIFTTNSENCCGGFHEMLPYSFIACFCHHFYEFYIWKRMHLDWYCLLMKTSKSTFTVRSALVVLFCVNPSPQ